MKQSIQFIVTALFLFIFGINYAPANIVDSDIEFHPIKHATFVIQSKTATIYVDPVGDSKLFDKYPKPDIILITDIHKDHLNKEVVANIKYPDTLIICTKAAETQLKEGKILNNGESLNHQGIVIEAIPAYNLTPERLKFHPKGRGNGYLISISGKRIYISGDTEDIIEMKSLKNIENAFVCMNLPYTMTEDQAASAVLTFKPKVVFPYHYRGKNGFSNIDKFKATVEKAGYTQVKLLTWY
jgi:L-ascorbate metabolism protein UlaG (beta-lactamase superfamily)